MDSALSAEALAAVTGIFPKEPASVIDGKTAALIPGKWRTAIKSFFDRSKPLRFKSTRLPSSYDKITQVLNEPDDNTQWLSQNIVDPDIITAYLTVISNGREYIRERWHSLTIDAFPTPRNVEPGRVIIAQMGMLYNVVNDPSTLIDEVQSWSLQTEQVDAVKAVFPSLFNMILQLIEERKFLELSRSQSWTVSWDHERVLRRLYSLPPEVSISQAPKPQGQMGNGSAPAVQIKLTDESTRAERIASK